MQNIKNKKQTGYVLFGTIIPILIILLIVFGAGYFLIGDDIKLPTFGKDLTEVRRLEDFPTTVYTKSTIDKQRQVIKSQEELDSFFEKVSPEGDLILLEDIDFEKEMLIGVSSESSLETGRELKIRKLYVEKEERSILVSLIEERLDKECEIVEQNNIVVDLVAVTKTDWDIDFEKIKQTKESCE